MHNGVLQAYYRAQRSADDRNAARTTMRLLQSIIRLSQAHARLMLRDVVTVQDAVVAVVLMESTMEGAALLGGVNALHAAFPDNPEEEHKIQGKNQNFSFLHLFPFHVHLEFFVLFFIVTYKGVLKRSWL
ncbi:DNA helicase MCM9-like [Octopus bimaculoides]|uniref:DNA helicase MCM9-like n=1 Tax=Octopus bimaculoides TaxID=37653 RepID=UPI0022E10C47|nr:DNA helicase MCM9-like [Octopus bimaculoides]